jgi:hypothetical protein
MQVSQGVGRKTRSANFDVGRPLRAAGRLAIWAVVGLLLIRGLGAILETPRASAPVPRAGGDLLDPADAALAVRFARAYLSDPSPRALAPFLAEGARVGRGRPPASGGTTVAQAEVSATEDLGGGGAVLTVACELRDARALYLAVPISRSKAGEVAVSGVPWVVAAPSAAGAAAERPRPIAGPDADAIGALVGKFIPAYVSARRARDLSYLLAPGAAIAPLGGSLELRGGLAPVAQLGDGEGRRRTVVAAGRFRDVASGAVYRLAYRLELVRRDRWYVRAIEGALS